MWTKFTWLKQGAVVGSCGYENRPPDSIECGFSVTN